MRDGADHLMTVEYDTKRMTTCPIKAGEQYIVVGTALGWNMTQGYLFPRISRRPNTGAPIKGGDAHISTRYDKGAQSRRV